ncbi:MAG: DUF2007 domain-containing protein [Nitriliruptor sp.]|uniref:putative signal transducing protein n=1 Tax=Nitriliruptor sp. TaxID=2448056 RepID=UPI0034A05EFC
MQPTGSEATVDEHPPAEHVATVRVGHFLSRAEAEVARGMLESSGVPAVVIGDDGGGVQPDVSYGYGGVAIGVHPDDVEEARELLLDVDAPLDVRDLRTPNWRSRLVLVTAVILVALLLAGIIQR